MVQRRESVDDAPLREELAQLRADIDSLIGTVGRLADTAGEQIMSGARHTAASVHDRAGEAFDTAMAQGRRTLKSTEKTIQAHPYLSLAIAAGIGLLLGKLIAGRD
jgi:ElaB/YqjD/DUF883 family membrane-anchored ribosome-binding protein